MKAKVILFGTLIGAMGAMAQETPSTPRAEVGLNYTYNRVNPGGSLGSYNSNGGSGYVEYNFNKTLGFVAELGGTHVGTDNGVALNNTTFDYLFGPRFNFRHSRFNPYVQALFGGERYSNGLNPAAADPRLNISQNNFAAAFGGGIDVTLTNHIAVKPIQVEYLLTEISPANVNYVQNNLRYSAGVVFRFGSK